MDLNFTWLALVVIIGLGYYLIRKRYSHWADQGIPFVRPEFPFGNFRGVGTSITAGHSLQKCYKQLKGKCALGGIFIYLQPAILVVDLDILRNIFVKDFRHFHDRGFFMNERDDPLSAHLFSLEGEKWKNLRTKLSPTFTSGKMKMMHPTILQVADQFRDHLRDITSKNGTELELRELLAQFTTDVIGNVAFGLQCNSMKDPNNEFRNTGRIIFEPSLVTVFKDFFLFAFPDLGRKLRFKLNKPEVTQFFMKLIKDVVKHREDNKVQRNDFMSLLLQIKNTGRLEGETVDLGKLTFEELAAQVFLFFVAGFETSSSTMTFSFYELALNPHIQERARQEVEDVIKRHGELNYAAAMELTYIDQIIHETLRKYPVVESHFRKVTIPYKIPGTDVVLPKGQILLIPVLGIQRDPEIYPDPDKFDPERFTKENIAARHPCAWMPFGDGPRNCIGLRFGMMQTRLGIASILKNFVVSPSQRTTIPMKFAPGAQILSPIDGMYLNLRPIS